MPCGAPLLMIPGGGAVADLPAALGNLQTAVEAAGSLLDDTTRMRLERQLDEVARRQGFLGPTVVATVAHEGVR